MSVSMVTSAAVAVVSVAVAASGGGDTTGYQRRQRQDISTGAAGLAAAAFIGLPNSRGAETEADKLGVELASRAGYDPAAAVTLWKKMMEANGQKSSSDFMSTHPSPPNRIAALEALQGPMNLIYEERKGYYANYTPSYQYVKVDAKVASNDPILNSSNVRVVDDPILSAPNVRIINDPSNPGAALNTLAGPPEAPEAGKALVFYSPRFETFKQGTLELACIDCSFKFYLNQGDFKKMYGKKDWRLLAQSVIKVDYKIDLSYFYLAAAAEGLGFSDAAKIYSAKAVELAATEDHACARAKMIKCDGIEVSALSDRSSQQLLK
ncbi:MAG: M48 family metalloprotease, partial [Methylophilaceae bacterium]